MKRVFMYQWVVWLAEGGLQGQLTTGRSTRRKHQNSAPRATPWPE